MKQVTYENLVDAMSGIYKKAIAAVTVAAKAASESISKFETSLKATNDAVAKKVDDAEANGKTYGRKDGKWVEMPEATTFEPYTADEIAKAVEDATKTETDNA